MQQLLVKNNLICIDMTDSTTNKKTTARVHNLLNVTTNNKYAGKISPDTMDKLFNLIYKTIVIEQRYLDSEFSAKMLASELGTNTRYISAVVKMKFGVNYSELINYYRIQDAMILLRNPRFNFLRIEEIGEYVGYTTRQCFYMAFMKFVKETPKIYRDRHFVEVADNVSGEVDTSLQPNVAPSNSPIVIVKKGRNYQSDMILDDVNDDHLFSLNENDNANPIVIIRKGKVNLVEIDDENNPTPTRKKEVSPFNPIIITKKNK